MPSLTQAAPPKSDQLNADDLIGGPRTITVREVRVSDSGEQRVSVYFDGDDGKPFKPCKSMIRVMAHVWGDESESGVGQSMTLFCDPGVKFGGSAVGGIRISHMTGLKGDKSFGLTATRGRRAQYTVKPLNIDTRQKTQTEGTQTEALELASTAAREGGKAGFQAWWKSEDGKKRRGLLSKEDVTTVQEICAEYDAPPEDDDTFPGERPMPNDAT